MKRRLARAIGNRLIKSMLVAAAFLNKILVRFSRRILKQFPHLKSPYYPRDVLSWTALHYPEYAGIDVMIETGTYLGDVPHHEKRRFKCIHTIEISEDLYNRAKTRLAPWPNIICHHGDSAEILERILEGINERAVFLLDAHWSGDASVDWAKSNWKGYPVDTGFRGQRESDGHISSEGQLPLLHEISLIAKGHPYASVIIIDDFFNIGKKNHGFIGEDWSHVSIDGILSTLGEKRVRAFFTLDSVPDGQPAKMLVILLRQK